MCKIVILLEGPSQITQVARDPYGDSAGRAFVQALHQAGITSQEVITLHTCPTFIPKPRQKSKVKLRYFLKNTAKNQVLKEEITANIPNLKARLEEAQPNVVLACGDAALFVMCGEVGITKWRSSILNSTGVMAGYKVIPTFTPEQTQAMYAWRFLQIHDIKRAVAESAFPEVRQPQWDFIIRPGFATVMRVLNRIHDMAATVPDAPRTATNAHDAYQTTTGAIRPANAPETPGLVEEKLLLSGDVETRQGSITCFGIAWSPLEALCIPLLQVGSDVHYWTEEEEREIVILLHKLFKHDKIVWTFQNGAYDFQYFARQWGFIPKHSIDTMIQQHTVWTGLQKSLDFQSSLYLDYHRYWKDEGKEFHNSVKSPADEDEYWTYNCKDCVVTYALVEHHQKQIVQYEQEGPYAFQREQAMVVLKMMLRGVLIDRERKSSLAMELLDAIALREQRLTELAGFPLNINSPKQVTEFFYQTLGQKSILNRYSGNPTADSNALELIGIREPLLRPLIDLINELRSLGVFLSTFVKAPLSEDGRFRSSYNICGTETLRWSSSKDVFGQGLNLQNIPKGNE